MKMNTRLLGLLIMLATVSYIAMATATEALAMKNVEKQYEKINNSIPVYYIGKNITK